MAVTAAARELTGTMADSIEEKFIELFADLFEGNTERYGTEHGGSVEAEYDWDDLTQWHLEGAILPIGVYPIDPDSNLCRWGCIDFDEGEEESLIHARNVENFLECEGLTAWVERSRSKGYHVWVFMGDWVLASDMRNALLYACEFMDAPTKEINPKQSWLAPGEVGNYVRLPYPSMLHDDWGANMYGQRRVVVAEDGWDLPLSKFVTTASLTRNSPLQLIKLAHRYKPTPRITKMSYTYLGEDITEEIEELLQRLSRDARRLYDNGPRNADRSSTLCALAGCIARDRTHEPAEARALLAEADKSWGKYHDGRHDTDLRLDEIVDRAYGDLERNY